MKKIAIIKAEFYPEITKLLLDSVKSTLDKHKVKTTEIEVPGCFELPFVAKLLAEQQKYDGFITIGCVIRGETSHYDLVCETMANSVNEIALSYNFPHGFGVATVETYQQAVARANKMGRNAAKAVMKLIEIKENINNDQ